MVNNQKPNNTESSSILGRLPIIFLAFIFLIAAGSLLLRYAISQKLTILNSQLSIPPQNDAINNLLLDLNTAENDFQQASLYGYNNKLEEYKKKLTYIFAQTEELLKNRAAVGALDVSGEEYSFQKDFDGKLDISLRVFELKKNFDSLLVQTTTENLGAIPLTLPPIIQKKNSVQTTSAGNVSDTLISKTGQVEKKGLFNRLKDAIINKPDSQVTKIIEINRERSIADSVTRIINIKVENERRALLAQLGLQHNRLTTSQSMLLEANRSLIVQLRHLIDEIRVTYFRNWENNRAETLKQYRASVSVLNTFTLIAILLVLIFIVLLIFSIRKVAKAERQLRVENARAIALAEQKSELLAIMSHEIRNPLTTISGFIYMLEKTDLSAKQLELIKPVKQASSMLQDTVNDILDMSKFESLQAAALKEVSFLPNKEIKETIDNMKFSAVRKNISLNYHYEGDDHTEITGDAFRLKQIIINLLSNAIKYTDKGEVTVNASLNNNNGEALLVVHITDTGAGISAEHQAKLFIKYYQANNATDKPGTGLGLYICDQLIKLQKGRIRVKSEAGKGSTFSFEIPYRYKTS